MACSQGVDSPAASRSAPHGGHRMTSSSVGTSRRLPHDGQKRSGPTLSGMRRAEPEPEGAAEGIAGGRGGSGARREGRR